ncbi:MAG: hypothetical protein IPI27_12375 [Betaproteobacteria bacterium]|nr:hypothetical protein [Betaproteobacteria bacterium]
MVVEGYPEGVTLGTHFLITVRRILLGYFGALALALPLGLLIGWVSVLDRLTELIIAFCRSVATLSLPRWRSSGSVPARAPRCSSSATDASG